MGAFLQRIRSDARLRKIVGRIAYVFCVAVFVEVALQLFYYATAGDFLFRRGAPPLYQSEQFAGYGNRRGLSFDHRTNEFEAHYYINQQGFRVPRPGLEYSLTKPANTYRILLLGPSFAYGWGVEYEKSFGALLPQLLTERGFAKGKKIELINAGIPSMPPASQLNWYEHVGKNYRPDLVLQIVYGTMLEKSDPRSNYLADAQGHLIETDLSTGQRWRDRAKQFATVFYGWMVWTEFDGWLHTKPASDAVQGAGRELVQETNFDINKPRVADALAFYEHLADAVRASGARLQIVYLPLSYVIYPEDESRWRHLGVRDVRAQQAFDSAFVDRLNKQNIPTVDITGDLRRAAMRNKRRLYYWLDIHWTVAGNAAAARAVADKLAGTGQPKSSSSSER